MIELNVDGAKKKIEKDSGVNLDFWQEIFWQNNSIQINNPKELKKKLDDYIDAKLNILYGLANQPEKFEIKVEGNKDLERQLDAEIKAHIVRGQQEDANFLNANRQKALEKLAKNFGEKQFEEYKHLVVQIQNSDYPNSFKALILTEAVNFVYRTIRKDGQEVLKVEKRKPNQTIFGLPNFHDEVLKYIFKNGQKSSSFKELYVDAQKEFQKTVLNSSQVNFENLNTFGKGKWLIFKGKANDPEHFNENVAQLKALVQETPWCTKMLASTHLDQGDFYVFVDKNKKPHIAVKMTGNSIGEVRGIKNGMAQELEDDYRDVAINFLENNQNIKDGKEWLKKEEWNKRLILWKEQIENGTFELKNVELLIKDLFFEDFRSHGRNSNLDELKMVLPKAKPQLAQYYKVPEDEICVGDFSGEECPYSIVLGNVDGKNTLKADKLKIVLGKADFGGSQITDLSSLEEVGREAIFEKSQVSNLGRLKKIGSTAIFSESQIKNLGSLVYIGGAAHFTNCKGTNLSSLKYIGGAAVFTSCKGIDLRNLKTIGYDAFFNFCQGIDLRSLVKIGGNAYFSQSKGIDLRSLEKIGQSAFFDGSECQINDLSNLKTIGKYVYFSEKIPKIDALEKTGNIYRNKKLITLQEAKEFAKAYQKQLEEPKEPELTA